MIPGRCLEPFDDSGASSRVPPSVAKVEEPRRPGVGPPSQPPSSPQTSTRSAFYRAVNFNGSGFVLDGNRWEPSEEAANCLVFGRPSQKPDAPLDPPADGLRALLLGTVFANAGATDIVLARMPPAAYQVFLYVRSDGGPERFSVTLGGRAVERDRSLGPAGRWARLGPWEAGVTDGAIRLAVSGGAVNVCGIEIWKRE